MEVKLRVQWVGAAGNFPAGTVVDFPDHVAEQLIRQKAAEPVEPPQKPDEPKPEAAALGGAPEKAVLPGPAKKKR